MNENKPKKIEIVSDGGKNLNISPVYDHIDMEKPKQKDERKVVVPKEKK